MICIKCMDVERYDMDGYKVVKCSDCGQITKCWELKNE